MGALMEAYSLCVRVRDYRLTMRFASPATINAHELIHRDLLFQLDDAMNRVAGWRSKGDSGDSGDCRQAPAGQGDAWEKHS